MIIEIEGSIGGQRLCPNCAHQDEKHGNLGQFQATWIFQLNVGHVAVNASFSASCQKAIGYWFSDFKSSCGLPEGRLGGFDSHAPPPFLFSTARTANPTGSFAEVSSWSAQACSAPYTHLDSINIVPHLALAKAISRD
jgi:hypothetical protein